MTTHEPERRTAAETAATPGTPYPPASISRSALVLLMLIYLFNFLDRQVVNILAQSIKEDLGLSDWQLGAISGLAFALFYSLLGLPIARYAERGDRPVIIAVSVTIWSAFTIICGAAQNFLHLLLARVGVGIGEAGGVPPSHSLISEMTPREKRASALAFFSMATPLGAFAGLALGGLMADAFGWRAAFLIAGAPGLLLGLLALLMLKEPRRAARNKARPSDLPSLLEAGRILLGKRTFILIAAGASVQAIASFGIAAFLAPFFLRKHAGGIAELAAGFGLQPTGFIGIALGLTTGLAAALGTLAGGYLADRRARKDIRIFASVPAFCTLLTIPAYAVVFLAGSVELSLVFLMIASVLASAWFGPVHATCQSIVQPRMRATISAVLLMLVNLIGLGLGPATIGFLSDIFQTQQQATPAEGLQSAMLISLAFTLASVPLFLAARRTIASNMES